MIATASQAMSGWAANPFNLGSEDAYQRWREWKLEQAPSTIDEILIEVEDPNQLSPSEHVKLLACCRRTNMVVYVGRRYDVNENMVRRIGRQFGLQRLDANWLADEEGISSIAASGDGVRQSYIPYTNHAIKWHTDGYYNPPQRRICGMMLHCIHSAAEGGENHLMDPEIAYLLVRDHNPDFVRALSTKDAMTIPERKDEDGVARATQSGPVFSVDEASGFLHMRYTARTRSIEWKNDAITQAAVAYLEGLLCEDSSYVYRTRLEPGMGLLCNNILHDRSGFIDNTEQPRLLYRARYYDRIIGT